MAKRIVYRKRKVIFKVNFFEDDERTIPVTPLNNNYPEYTIFDINNQVVATGAGQVDSVIGCWRIEWTPSATVPISTDTHKWRIEWLMVTDSNDSITNIETFDIVDEVIDEGDSLAQQTVGIATSENRVLLKLTTEYHDVQVTLFDIGTNNVAYGPMKKSSGKIHVSMENGGYIYYLDIPPNTLGIGCHYQVIWEVRRTVGSQVEHIMDRLIMIHPRIIQVIPDIRMLIDKFQKRLGRIHGYEDGDLYSFIEHGMGVVNNWHPATYYNLSTFPQALDTFWVMATSWWALNAQYILETDMLFDFSGQTVTLAIDRTGQLDSAIARFNEYLVEHLTKTKIAIVRASSPAGIVAVRPKRFNLLNQVFRVDRGMNLTPSVANMIYSIFG